MMIYSLSNNSRSSKSTGTRPGRVQDPLFWSAPTAHCLFSLVHCTLYRVPYPCSRHLLHLVIFSYLKEWYKTSSVFVHSLLRSGEFLPFFVPQSALRSFPPHPPDLLFPKNRCRILNYDAIPLSVDLLPLTISANHVPHACSGWKLLLFTQPHFFRLCPPSAPRVMSPFISSRHLPLPSGPPFRQLTFLECSSSPTACRHAFFLS